MVDFGPSTNFNIGATKTGADAAAANNSNLAVMSPGRQLFKLSARLLAQERGAGLVQQQQNNQIDPALLARISLEEELKKRGGGGGGMRSFNPMVFVPYSFKLLAQAIDQLRAALMQALNQGLAMPAPIQNTLQSVQSIIGRVFNNPFVANLTTAINQSFAQLANAMRNPLATANKLATNVMQFANAIASAVASGLKKVFGGKEEDKLDPDNIHFKEDDGFLKRVWGMFADVANDANQSNARNIKSHIDNLANQVTRWMSRSFDFTKRWF
ncbi:MAG: hypothetical protein HOA17_09160 [Candidatus Melainabacteria bacterium]|nr:hypothetical protein [Candidatus Melainabacteria bacterium]